MADNTSASTESADAQDLSPGATLRETREAQKKSLQDVSDELHLDRWMLEALERNDFAALGAPVFAKGHLRQYAKLLGIEPDDLMVAYYQVCGSREQPPLLAESMLSAEGHGEQSFSWLWPTLITLAVISGSGAAIYLWMQPAEQPSSVSSESNDLTLREAPVELPVVSETKSADSTLVLPAEVNSQTQETPGTDKPPVARPLLIPASEAPQVDTQAQREPAATGIVSNNLTLTLRFTDESWVEVYDSRRQKLLYGLVDSATVKYLSGPPPISVFLGRQSAVRVEVNGNPYKIPREALKGNTARFQIDAPR